MTLKEGHKILNRMKRMADDNLIEKSLNLEAPTSNPLPAKRPRSEEVVTDDNDTKHKVQAISISSARPHVQTLESTKQTIVPETDDAEFTTKRSSIGELIDTHFNNEKVKKQGLGGCCNAIEAYSIRAATLACRMVLEFDDLEKERDAHLKQIAELEKKLEKNSLESEKILANMTGIKDEEINILKTNLEEMSLEKSEWIKREEELMEENRKITLKFQMLENTHKVTADKLMAEMEELKAGFDKAVKHVLASLS